MEVHKEFGEKHHNATLSGIETLSVIVLFMIVLDSKGSLLVM